MFCDNKESLLNESGTFLIPLKENCFSKEHCVSDISGLISNPKLIPSNQNKKTTIFISLGISIFDLSASYFIYKKAKEIKEGTFISF